MVALYLCGRDRVMVIFGASAATWRYRQQADAARFDRRVQQVLSWGQENLKGVALVSGAAELASIEDHEVMDRIGHLKYHFGFQKLLAAVHRWYGILLQEGELHTRRSKL